jgi:hypothetical protein
VLLSTSAQGLHGVADQVEWRGNHSNISRRQQQPNTRNQTQDTRDQTQSADPEPKPQTQDTRNQTHNGLCSLAHSRPFALYWSSTVGGG